MTHHSELINLIAKKIKALTYLEIGVFNPAHNFNKIEVCAKVGVDPDPNAQANVRMTSDQFLFVQQEVGALYDLIFIDGLHHAGQVKKDLINSWQCLSPGGVIVVHDCNPPSEETTCVPRGQQREWCGDVYKTICQITSPGFYTVDFDYGCCMIRKGSDPLALSTVELNWETLNANREILLNLVSTDKAKEIIDAWI